MSTPAIPRVTAEGLSIVPTLGKLALTIALEGSCDSLALPALGRFLDQMHGEVVRACYKRVDIDCERLYFMNSASVKCFVVWLTKIKASPKASHYEVHFITNPHLAWQRRSFGTIRRSLPELVTLSDEGLSA